jgi:hypothetical protein
MEMAYLQNMKDLEASDETWFQGLSLNLPASSEENYESLPSGITQDFETSRKNSRNYTNSFGDACVAKVRLLV